MRALVLAVLAACSVSSTREFGGRSDGRLPSKHGPSSCLDDGRPGGLSGVSQMTIDARAPLACTQPMTNRRATQLAITPLLCPDPELANPTSDDL
jgi:hypothetical protein